MSKPALGRGLGALLGTPPAAASSQPPTTQKPAAKAHDTDPSAESVRQVPLNRIRPCSLQPRKDFSVESLTELADSIREKGIVQPLIVREQDDGLELIAGERRWRAAQILELATVPVIVRQADDQAVLEMALIENLQREDLNPIEEALGYTQLASQFKLTQEEIAGQVGKSRAAVANATRLLKLSPEIQGWIREGRLSVGHAKVILGLENPRVQQKAAERVIKEALNVRQTEVLVARLQAIPSTQSEVAAGSSAPDSNVSRLEDRIRERVGTKVRLKYKAGKGKLEIAFFSDDELDGILEVLGIETD